MPNYAGKNQCSLKFDLPVELRAAFFASAKRNGISASELMRYFMATWLEFDPTAGPATISQCPAPSPVSQKR